MGTGKRRKKRLVGIALGSGSARGWGHIGVLSALSKAGIEPDIVCGTSVGALVGAAYASNKLKAFEDWVLGLNVRDIVRYMDIRLVASGGFVQGNRFMDFYCKLISDERIEDLPRAFATCATDLNTGREIWFRNGSLTDALRAAIALPGIFTPVRINDNLLVDGGLVNPVPVSLCRVMGAEVVIAVNLNGDIVGKHFRREKEGVHAAQSTESRLLEKLAVTLRKRATSFMPQFSDDAPGLFDVLATSINIMQDRITRSRMSGDPPDVILSPRLSHIDLLEFDRAEEAIAEGMECVSRMLPAIRDVVDSESDS